MVPLAVDVTVGVNAAYAVLNACLAYIVWQGRPRQVANGLLAVLFALNACVAIGFAATPLGGAVGRYGSAAAYAFNHLSIPILAVLPFVFPRALSAAEREVLTASNAFAFSLAGELIPAPTENLFYSPLSASMLLGMILNGADGETYAQMRTMLGFGGLSQEQINKAYSDLIDLLLGLDPAVTMELGNSVWTQSGFPVLPDFMSRVRSAFRTEADDVDFGSPQALQRINGWANDATHGRIEKIFVWWLWISGSKTMACS